MESVGHEKAKVREQILEEARDKQLAVLIARKECKTIIDSFQILQQSIAITWRAEFFAQIGRKSQL